MVNYTSCVTVVTPTDGPKSARDRCVIGRFGGVLCYYFALHEFSVGIGALSFVIL